MISMIGTTVGFMAGPRFEGPVLESDGTAMAPGRDRMVNRLLDWSEQARRAGREERAEFLLSLAWEAYDR